MKKNESGRSLIEMMMVLALMGILTIGSIGAYQVGQRKSEANKIHELVSTASLNSLTKMRKLCHTKEVCPKGACPEGYKKSGGSCIRCCSSVWDVIGKNSADYKCVISLDADSNGNVTIKFSADCQKAKDILITQWGTYNADTHPHGWDDATNTYYPPKDDE